MFSAELLGFVEYPDDPNEPGDEECMIVSTDGSHRLLCIEVPDAKQVKNRMHVDLNLAAALHAASASPGDVLRLTFFLLDLADLGAVRTARDEYLAGADVAATLGASSVNAGIAVGSVIGGVALAHGGADTTVLVAAIIAIAVLPATWATRYLHTTTPTTDSAPRTTTDSLPSAA